MKLLSLERGGHDFQARACDGSELTLERRPSAPFSTKAAVAMREHTHLIPTT
jgi:hypothetical protein